MHRCRGKLPLQKALVQALQCPLLSGRAACVIAPRLHRRRAQRPVWREESCSGPACSAGYDAAATFYTIRVINGQQRVVRRSVTAKRCVFSLWLKGKVSRRSKGEGPAGIHEGRKSRLPHGHGWDQIKQHCLGHRIVTVIS